jgi:hypothetical protein
MIGDVIRAVEIALLKESLGVIMSEGSRAISKGLAEAGLAHPLRASRLTHNPQASGPVLGLHR